MKKRKSVILIAAITIAMCFVLLAAGTYALFSDKVTLSTHLKAGSMNITLQRTNLVTKTLDNGTGYIKTQEYTQTVDFSGSTGGNVFELTQDTLIVPCCSFDAEMLIANNSDTAFSWWIEIVLNGENVPELARQLKVTVTCQSNSSEQYLSNGLTLGSASAPVSTLEKGDDCTFNVKVEFVDDNEVNNDAQAQSLDFDLLVHAIQVTQAA